MSTWGKQNTSNLCRVYWQVLLTQRSQELMTFKTPWGLFQFTVLPFVLHGYPATFLRLMDQVLCQLFDFSCVYLDDIVIYSATWEEHLGHQKEVLERLHSSGLTINPTKCVLARTENRVPRFTVHYIPGKEHSTADYLSCCPTACHTANLNVGDPCALTLVFFILYS